MSVGENIKRVRMIRGISQIDLANKAKISKQTLYKYENNIITNIPSDKIERIAIVLNVSPSDLMGWGDNGSFNNCSISNNAVLCKANSLKLETKVDEKTIIELNPDEKELLRIYQILNLKGKTSLLNYAYELEEKQEREK